MKVESLIVCLPIYSKTLQPISTKLTQYIQHITDYPGAKHQLPNFYRFETFNFFQ
ncbi:hypothetical protein C0J52_22331 [Blattella germanica]|nr:hypothetical protein C0J52_22331 [Blattella germanica]